MIHATIFPRLVNNITSFDILQHFLLLFNNVTAIAKVWIKLMIVKCTPYKYTQKKKKKCYYLILKYHAYPVIIIDIFQV